MSEEQVAPSPDVHFEPIIKLPLIEIATLEEDEEILFQMRAKLFRYDSSAESPEWKERGTGDIKILKHRDEDFVRIVMRRDKTLKICANHYIQPYMELKPNNTSDRAWIWNTMADFADEEPKPELLAIKFANAENAQKFKSAFEEAKNITSRKQSQTDPEYIPNGSTTVSSSDDEESENDVSKGDTENKDSVGDEAEFVAKLGDLSLKKDNEDSKDNEDATDSKDKEDTTDSKDNEGATDSKESPKLVK